MRANVVETDQEAEPSLRLEHVNCPICRRTKSEPVGLGPDFEYRTSPHTFLAVRCTTCDVVYLDPRPAATEFDKIYPSDYHSFDFTEQDFGFVHRVRSGLERHRLIKMLDGVPDDARVLDVGCGDGFHLDLLQGHKNWRLEGVDLDDRAVAAARERGLDVHRGSVEDIGLPKQSYDAVFMIQTIEHVTDPLAVVTATQELLKPGGRLLIVTDNTGSLDFRIFRNRHWGGYHFPRHLTLFNRRSLTQLAHSAGLGVTNIETIVSPVNWVYSIRNTLDDYGAPRWLVEQFSLKTPLTLAVFTVFDAVHVALGRGALLRAEFRRAQ